MIIRSYSGRTVPEALEKVRKDLGDQALIIETRERRGDGLFAGKVGYEVVAALDAAPEAETDNQASRLARARAAEAAYGSKPEQPPSERSDSTPELETELAAIRRQLARLASGQGTPTAHLGDELAQRLEDQELPADLIAACDEVLAQAGERLPPQRRHLFLQRYLERGLDCHEGLDWNAHRAVMLVGPTGVGKTTTIAKLAGDLVLRHRRRVALVTIDTYRVGAADQLQAYADMLDCPLDIAQTPAQLKAALERHSDVDHILVDTAGRSPSHDARIHELRAFCRACPRLTVMLTVAATAGRPEFASVIERFSILPITATAVTKLDECISFGRLYGCLRRHRLPLHFLANGQEVPDDIMPASAGAITGRLIAGELATAR